MHAHTAFDRLVALATKIPKEPDRVIFVGRSTGLLIDNGKYGFLATLRHAPQLRTSFLTFDTLTAKILRMEGLPALCFDEGDAPLELAKAGIVVCDDFIWKTRTMAGLFVQDAFLVQLWHGIPLKAIGFPEIHSDVNMTPEKARELTFAYSGYDAVLSTSPFFCEKAFSRAFDAKAFWNLGYPRNDVLQRPPVKEDMLNVDKALYGDLVQAKKRGLRIVFYMPTFRDLGGNAFSEEALKAQELADFATKNNILVICKFHPYENIQAISTFPNFRFCAPHSDPYPLLRLADLLVTDYSSIYFDFLLTGKPILFFPYDLESYVTRNRELLFAYDTTTPGPKAKTTSELFAAMQALLDGDDPYVAARQELKGLAFTYPDANAGKRLAETLGEISGKLAQKGGCATANEDRL